jgi:acyl carrier protein
MDKDAVVEKLIKLLESSLGKVLTLSKDSTLLGDAGLESIQVIEYLCEVEDAFDVVVDEESLSYVSTFGDLASVVERISSE